MKIVKKRPALSNSQSAVRFSNFFDFFIVFLKQLSNMHQINLFKLSLEELEAYHDYLRAIKKYADSIT
ncbi:hypothetical protein [Lactococcus lactis]|uniref:hypothetical protein n=1 Tax=Lactococcus lactis TaxID=1358 RepID=UPI003D2F1CF3